MSVFQGNPSFTLVSFEKINFHKFMMQRLRRCVIVPTLSSDPEVSQHKQHRGEK